jgi:hypothetical protein
VPALPAEDPFWVKPGEVAAVANAFSGQIGVAYDAQPFQGVNARAILVFYPVAMIRVETEEEISDYEDD